MITNERVMEVLKEAGVLLEGHFKLTSGRHSNKYLQCAKIFRYTKYAEELCKSLAEQFAQDNVELVIGPAIGAIAMSYETSRHLNVENIFAERDADGVMQIRRGFEITKGQNVLIVEDVVTTGGSVKEVIELVKNAGGNIIGIGSIVDRTGGNIDFGFPYKSVISMEVTSWDEENCPLCKEGSTAIKPGSRNI